MKTRKKILIAGVVFLAIVGLLLALSIPQCGPLHRDEPGLLTGCPDPATGILDYDAEPCPEVRWERSQIPISIYASTDNHYPVQPPRQAIGAAIAIWNTRLGFDLFELVDEPGEADALFLTGTTAEVGTWETDANGTVQHRVLDAGGLVAEVRTWNTATVGFDHEVNVHELAHLAGLAHDDFEDSAVSSYPIVPRDDPRIWITDHDRELLRELYHD